MSNKAVAAELMCLSREVVQQRIATGPEQPVEPHDQVSTSRPEVQQGTVLAGPVDGRDRATGHRVAGDTWVDPEPHRPRCMVRLGVVGTRAPLVAGPAGASGRHDRARQQHRHSGDDAQAQRAGGHTC